MAVSPVGATSGTSVTTATSFATSLPAGWQPGDFAILAGHSSATSLTMSVPAGWIPVQGITNPTDQGTNSRQYVWQRALQAGDTAPTITNSGAITGGWEMVVVRGADTVSPIGQVGTTSVASAASLALSALTGVAAGSALIAVAHARVATGTLPNGINWNAAYTEVTDVSTSRATTAANLRNSSAYRLVASAGSYGGESVTVANSVASSMIASLIEVKQASSTPSTVALTPATLTLSAPPVSAAPNPVAVALTPATLTLSAPPVSAAPKPVAVALTPATLTLSAPPVSAAPKPVAVALTPATLTLSAVPPAVTSISGPSTVTLTPAVLTLSAVAPAPAPRAVNRTLAPAVLRLDAVPVSPTPLAVTVALAPAVIGLAATPVGPEPIPATVTLAAAEFTLAATPVELVFFAAAHTVSASGQPHRISVEAPATHIATALPAARVTAGGSAQASVRRTA